MSLMKSTSISPLFSSQQEARLALNRTEVGDKQEDSFPVAPQGWQEQFPVLPALPEDSPPRWHKQTQEREQRPVALDRPFH